MEEKMKKAAVLFLDAVIVVLLVFIDRKTKIYAIVNLRNSDPVDIIKDVLQLYYLKGGNTGAAFGMLQGQKTLFILICFAVIAVIGYLLAVLPADKKYRYLRVLLLFIAAGGIGNMIDRISYGSVIDFIYIKIINFPIFNVADIYVSCSVVLLALYIIFKKDESELSEMEAYIKRKKVTGKVSDNDSDHEQGS